MTNMMTLRTLLISLLEANGWKQEDKVWKLDKYVAGPDGRGDYGTIWLSGVPPKELALLARSAGCSDSRLSAEYLQVTDLDEFLRITEWIKQNSQDPKGPDSNL